MIHVDEKQIRRKEVHNELIDGPVKPHDRGLGNLGRLQAYHWPGNVRELENLVERTLLRGQADSPDKPLRFETLHSGISEAGIEPAAAPSEHPLLLDDAMRRHISRVLTMAKGKVQGKTGAAALLGINPSTLRNRMNKLGIPYGRNDTSLAGAEQPGV